MSPQIVSKVWDGGWPQVNIVAHVHWGGGESWHDFNPHLFFYIIKEKIIAEIRPFKIALHKGYGFFYKVG